MNCDVVTRDEKLVTERSVPTIPPDILCSPQRPDIVILNRARKEIILVELTIPFETNIEKAQEMKAARYAPLVAGLQDVGFKCSYYSLEIGARGILSFGSSKTLSQISGASRKRVKTVMKDLSQIVIQCSYLLFKAKDCDTTFDFIMHP